MKAIKILLTLLVVSTMGFSQYRNVALQAAGLTCSMCSNAINKALKPLSFVEKIDTDLKSNLFVITVKPGTTPDFDLLKKKVEDAGFSVGKLTVEVNFGKQAITNDTHVKVGGKNLHFLKVKDQTLNGWQKVQLVDKPFMVSSQFKKMEGATKMACYKSGVSAGCCNDTKAGERIFHVTI
ncbi:MAG: heavy metal-associated domain-containing protein [Bacteroidota bacterium]